MRTIGELLKRLAPPALILLLLWQVAAEAVMLLRDVEFPTPWTTLLRLVQLAGGDPLSGSSLYVHIEASLRRWAAGFGFAAAAGVTFGLIAGQSRRIGRLTEGIPQTLLLVPGLAWVPVAILLFGIGEHSTIFMIAMAAFAPIAINVLSGVRSIDPKLIMAARMLGAGRRALFFRVLIPAALPAMLSGLRIGLGTAWRVLVAAEMVVGTGTGLGHSIIQARWTLDYASSFACIVTIVALGLFFEHILLRQLEKRTVARWQPSGGRP